MSIIFLLFPVVLFGFLISIQIASKKKAGRILLDIGPLNVKWMLLAIGYFNILTALYSLCSKFISGIQSWQYTEYFSTFFYGILISIYLLTLGYSRLQACEHGMQVHSGLIEWERIESFSWEPENEKTWFLTLRYPGRLPLSCVKLYYSFPLRKRTNSH